jgi:alpha-amylase
VIYFLLVDRFANGDPANDGAIDPADPQAFHGGDLAGVTAHVDELADLGVDKLWLGPIAKMRDTPFYGHGAFHGYWTDALDRLEPRFGNDADLAALRAALERRGIGLVLDVVYNHLAPDHPWVAERPDWFHHAGPIVNWHDPLEVVTHDVHGLPDLAQENPAVVAWLHDASLGWLGRAGPVAFRLDAVRHLDPAFLARIGADLRAAAPAGFELWGEVFDGSVTTLLDTRAAAGLDAVFDFPLHYALADVVCDDAPAAAIPAVLDRTAALPPEAFVTFLDNHDTARITTRCHDDPARVDLAIDLLFALRGRPMITWGTEWGARGAGEPENRADMRWAPSDAADATAHAARVERLRRRAAERAASPALRAGASRTLGLGRDWFVIERAGEGDVRWVIYNGGPVPLAFGGRAWPPRSVSVVDPAAGAAALRAAAPAAGPAQLVAVGAPPLGAGDRLRLVGGAALVGDWDPARGLDLPARVTLEPLAYTWKLVIVRADGRVEWAPGPNQAQLGGRGRVSVRWE